MNNYFQKKITEKFLCSLLIILPMLLLCMTWDGVFSFKAVDDLRIDQSGLFSMMYFAASRFNDGKVHLGSDYIFPYGPYLFFKYNLYWPGLYLYSIVIKYLFIGTFCSILIYILNINNKLNFKNSFFSLILFVWAFWVNTDAIYNIIFLVVAYLYRDGEKKIPSSYTILIMATLSIVALTKFTATIYFFLLIVIIFISCYINKCSYKPVYIPLIFFIFLWGFIGLNYSDFWPYVSTSWDLARYFGDALSLGWIDSPALRAQIIVFLGCSSFIAYINIKLIKFKVSNKIIQLSYLFYLGSWLFLGFKHGITRHDGHAAHYAISLILCSAFYFAIYINQGVKKYKENFVKFGLILCVILNFFVYNYWYPSLDNWSSVSVRLGHISERVIALSRAPFHILDYSESLRSQFQIRRNDFISQVGIPIPLSASVDSWPDNAALAIFSDGVYQPRPMPFAFSSYSESLSKINAQFLVGKDAPQFMFFDVAPVDNLFPTMEDPMAWISLIRNYSPTVFKNNLILLKREDSPREIVELSSKSISSNFGSDVEVPLFTDGSNLVTSKIDIEKTFLGKIISFIFKIPPPEIIITDKNGIEKNFRININLAKLGFIVSPVILQKMDFFKIYQSKYGGNKEIAKIRIVSKYSSLFYKDQISISFDHIFIKNLNNIKIDDIVNQNFTNDLLKSALYFSTSTSDMVRFVDIDGIKNPVLLAHAPTTISIPLEGNVGGKLLKFGYGMLPGSYDQSLGDGVIFKINANLQDGTTKLLFERSLNPGHNKADQKMFYADALVPLKTVGITLSTSPGIKNQNNWDHSYWSELKIK